MHAIRAKNLRSIFDGVEMPPGLNHFSIALSLRPFADLALPFGMMRVVMILMDGHNGG